MNNHKLMDKYNPKEFEEKLYNEWENKGYFKPSMDKRKESFCIVMPPPNVTGKLHMGHALDGTMQDMLIRYKRMCGYNTLWVPGRKCINCNRSKSCIKNEKRRRINKS